MRSTTGDNFAPCEYRALLLVGCHATCAMGVPCMYHCAVVGRYISIGLVCKLPEDDEAICTSALANLSFQQVAATSAQVANFRCDQAL